MVTKHGSLTLAALVGAGLFCMGSANAQSIVQTFTVPTQTVPINSTFTLNLFNSSLGTLNAVIVSLSTTITAEVDVYNFNGGPEPFSNATATIPITVTAPDAITATATAVAGPFSGTANPGVNPYTGIPASASVTQSVPISDFLFYEYPPGSSTGSINVTSTSGTYSGTAGALMAFGGSATASAVITITYDYSGTVPEPGVTTFLAAGVLGSLGLVLRRRRK